MVEALIGAFYLSGGVNAAVTLLRAIGKPLHQLFEFSCALVHLCKCLYKIINRCYYVLLCVIGAWNGSEAPVSIASEITPQLNANSSSGSSGGDSSSSSSTVDGNVRNRSSSNVADSNSGSNSDENDSSSASGGDNNSKSHINNNDTNSNSSSTSGDGSCSSDSGADSNSHNNLIASDTRSNSSSSIGDKIGTSSNNGCVGGNKDIEPLAHHLSGVAAPPHSPAPTSPHSAAPVPLDAHWPQAKETPPQFPLHFDAMLMRVALGQDHVALAQPLTQNETRTQALPQQQQQQQQQQLQPQYYQHALSVSEIHELEHVLGYRFRDRGLLCEALTHASAQAHGRRDNERLEYLGDAVLDLAVVVSSELAVLCCAVLRCAVLYLISLLTIARHCSPPSLSLLS
jgi:hypothetical protein